MEQIKTLGKKETEDLSKRFLLFHNVFFTCNTRYNWVPFPLLVINQNMQKLNEVLYERLISISEIS